MNPLYCPQCKKKRAHKQSMPFCSERCRLLDLGAWFDASYCISEPAVDAEDDDLTHHSLN